MLCQSDPFSYRYEVALEIADAQVFLEIIRLTRVAMIARSAPEAQSPEEPVIDPEDVKALKRDVSQGDIGVNAFIEARFRKPTAPKVFSDNLPLTKERQALEDFLGALSGLASLEHYERGALSRRRRAIRRFDALRDE